MITQVHVGYQNTRDQQIPCLISDEIDTGVLSLGVADCTLSPVSLKQGVINRVRDG